MTVTSEFLGMGLPIEGQAGFGLMLLSDLITGSFPPLSSIYICTNHWPLY